jgi:predicted RNase H-like HicB family nuclease
MKETIMRYTVLIDGTKGAYGVVVPDLPGCTAMGATIEAALTNVVAAMRDWAEVTEEAGAAVPTPRDPEVIGADAEVREALAGGAMLASAPLVRESGRPTKANLSLDSGILAAIDAEAGRQKLTRSAFVELMARRALAELA